MKILVVNCGSSSLKYQLLDMADKSLLCKGMVERIGMDASAITHTKIGMEEKFTAAAPSANHTEATAHVLKALVDPKFGVIKDMSEIAAVGHRVLHGGEKFTGSCLINEACKEAIRECIPLGPLHNPANLMGIEACEKMMPNTPQVAVFDTSNGMSMPEKSYIYPVPYEYYEKYSIRRYGFHGTSHRYIALKAAEMLGKKLEDTSIISCHLGNGASISAIRNGKCYDTSMGITPLEGLMMGTRCGIIDPALVIIMAEKENLSLEEVDDILNKKSGLLGVSGISSDSRDIEDAANKGNERARLALDIFNHRVKFYIGAYMALLNGCDAVVFTAGIGENSITSRAAICEDMDFLGIKLDHEKNNVRGKECVISADDSKVKILLIPTNEELMIAMDTFDVITQEQKS